MAETLGFSCLADQATEQTWAEDALGVGYGWHIGKSSQDAEHPKLIDEPHICSNATTLPMTLPVWVLKAAYSDSVPWHRDSAAEGLPIHRGNSAGFSSVQ